MGVLEIRSKFSNRQIYEAKELVELNEWNEQKSLAIRVTNLMGVLVAQLYGEKDVQDLDQPPQLEAPKEQVTKSGEEDALKKTLASRQTEKHQLESWERLKRSLEDQDTKRAQQNR